MNRNAIYLLALGAFGVGTAEFIVSGILEVISNDLNVPVSLAGQLVTVYALSHAFGALVLVMLTTKFERKRVLLSSMLIFIVGNIVAFFSYNFGMLMFSRIVLAMSGGLYFVIATIYAAQLAEPAKRGSAIATVITGFTVSLVLGVPIGTFIASFMDWRYVFLFIASITLIDLIVLNKYIPKLKGNKSISLKQQLLVIRDKQIISGLFTTLFWILGYTMVFTYIAPLLNKLADFSIEKISTALLVLGVFAFIGSRLGGYAADKWGPVRTVYISLIVHSVALFFLTATSISTIGVFIIIMVWGTAAWTTTPANQFYLISLKPQSSEIVLSFNTAIMNIGMTLGAGIGGLVIEYASVLNLGWIGGITVLMALVTASFSFTINKRKKESDFGLSR
ncbi:MFS transporter [Peribacillus loiseleuriae]|uniref:Chemotaxis protein n=1 Tax=Peribacillus loiseleuriae TaxID=1679170 RepID=A0A0K9GY66_9BACI|nr:MFS transporter [Peribacillus loiseleuriae]KMY51192.1 chemotaxis protein [Peribacillus loiseleuriae]